jgi:Tol biopolymer transport system component
MAALVVFCCQNLAAQPATIGPPRLLIPADGNAWLNPVWSPDGQFVAFTSAKYMGLWIARADGSNLLQISDAEGAGFGFSWSSDSRTILMRPSVFRDTRRFQSVELVNIETGERRVLAEPSRGINSLPQWAHRDLHVAVILNEELQLLESGKAPLGGPVIQAEEPVLYPLNGKICRFVAGQKDPQILADLGDKTILNIRFSAEGSRMAFQVAGQGLYVVNLDGSGLKHLGRSERPSWAPGGRYLVVMKTTDDGHRVIEGDLYALDTESGAEYNLTEHIPMVTLSPSVSPDGKYIAFENPEDGGIYILELSLGF